MDQCAAMLLMPELDIKRYINSHVYELHQEPSASGNISYGYYVILILEISELW